MTVESTNRNQQMIVCQDSSQLCETLNYLLDSNQRLEKALKNQEQINARQNAQINTLAKAGGL